MDLTFLRRCNWSIAAASFCAIVAVSQTAVSAKSQEPSVPVPPAIQGKGYTLVKNWDFSSRVTTKDKLYQEFYTRYIYNNGQLDTLNDEWERFRDNNNHVFDKNGLSLTARVTNGLVNGGIESGMLRSKWTGEYGYYEARLKVPAGRGMWPAFWLNPQDGTWPPEIDILEVVNNGRDTTKNSFHYLHGGKEMQDLVSIMDKWNSYHPPFDYATSFHTFAVLWTPDTVTHYVDGVLVVKRHFLWKHNDGTDGGPAHVLLNLSVGGGWPGAPQSLDEFPASLSVQYIRVWQNPAEKAPVVQRSVSAPNKPLDAGVIFDGSKAPDPASYSAASSSVSYSSAANAGLTAAYSATAQYPGVALRAPTGGWNLSPYQGITADLFNPGPNPVTVNVRVDNNDSGNASDAEHVVIPGGQSSTLTVKFGQSYGGPGYALDPTHITQVLLFADAGAAGSFTVKSIKGVP